MQPRGRGVGLFGGKPGPSLSDPPRLLALREIVLLICSLGGSKNGGALLKQLCVGGGWKGESQSRSPILCKGLPQSAAMCLQPFPSSFPHPCTRTSHRCSVFLAQQLLAQKTRAQIYGIQKLVPFEIGQRGGWVIPSSC